MPKRSSTFTVAALIALSAAAVIARQAEPPRKAFDPIATERLQNAHRVTEKILSGAQPEGEAAFAALRDLGVQTIISVDGAVPNVEMAVIPLASEPGVKFDYAIAMGVRFGEPEWKKTIERLIAENRRAIDTILREYGVPLVNERGELLDKGGTTQ